MTTVNCYVDAARTRKTEMMLGAFAIGCNGNLIHLPRRRITAPNADYHALWGQLHAAPIIFPQVMRRGEHTLQLDNGWFFPARGTERGYYRVTIDGPGPRYLTGFSVERAKAMGIELRPWRKRGRYVLVCMPGEMFGKPFGFNMQDWMSSIVARVKASTDREIIVRGKVSDRTLQEDLSGAWCVVTHSSGAAVEAVVSGVPVFCEPTCGSAPVSGLDLDIENCIMPEREVWLASLVHQQFTIPEFKSGFAWECLRRFA